MPSLASIAIVLSAAAPAGCTSGNDEAPSTSAVEQELGEWNRPACAPAALGPPSGDPAQCSGPWKYSYQEKWKNAAACGYSQICAIRNTCSIWDKNEPGDGLGYGVSSYFEGYSYTYVTQDESGQWGETCTDVAARRRAALLAQRPGVPPAAALALAVTADEIVVDVSQNGCGPFDLGCAITWTYACGLHVQNLPTPTATVPPLCSCAAYEPNECDRGDAVTVFTAPGALRPALGAPSPGSTRRVFVDGPTCMTQDSLPQSNATEVRAKFEELWKVYQGPPPTTVEANTFKRALSARLKLIYELWGEQLESVQSATDQTHRAVELYRTYPDDNPDCVSNIDAPAPGAACTAASVTSMRGDLVRCQRLLGAHASDPVASLAVDGCAALLSGYVDLAGQSEADASCGGAHLREVAARTLLKLQEKQLGVMTSAPATLGALPRQLWLLDRWYTASKAAESVGTFPVPEQQRRDTSFLLGKLWERVRQNTAADAQLAAASTAGTTDQAEQALGLSSAAMRAGERSVVNAMFTVVSTIQPENVTLNRPPLRGLPLLALLGDALKPLVDDLDGLAPFHDIACQFRDCRSPATDTPSRSAWKLLSELESSTLASSVTGNRHGLAGWSASLGKLAAQQETFLQATRDAAAGGLAGANEESAVQPLARPLWILYKHARSRHDHYEATGLFDPSGQRLLHGSLLAQNQHDVANAMRQRVAMLDSQLAAYREGLIAALRGQIAVMDAGARLGDLNAQRQRKAVQINEKTRALEGLRRAGEDEEAEIGARTKSFADLQSSAAGGGLVDVGSTTTLTLTGRDGRFTGSESIPALAVHTVPNLATGQLLVIHTSGSWTPTCAISDARFLAAGATEPVAAAVNAGTGPEGYTVTNRAGTLQASSAGSMSDERSGAPRRTDGMSVKLCSDGAAHGLTADACVSQDARLTSTYGWASDSARAARTTASFSAGLRLPGTPFPDAAVGSLLVVLTDPTSGAVRDVKSVYSDGTTIVVENPSNAYLVVNDQRCTTASDARALTVRVRTVTQLAAVANQALLSMVEVLTNMRAQRLVWVNQGALLPSQATQLREQARLALRGRLQEIGVQALPEPLSALFEALVTHEIVATERRIEITAVERSLDLDLLDLRAISDEIRAGAAHARLQRLVPQWLVRDLDRDLLQNHVLDLLAVARDSMKPTLDLWSPGAGPGLANGPEINAMLSADLDSTQVTLAGNATRFVRAVIDAYETSTLETRPPGVLPIVVVRFPRPGHSTSSFWRQADAVRSKRVWDAIDQHTVAPFEITPEDFYSNIGGDAVLSCSEVAPVIKTMELYAIRPGADAANQVLNGALLTLQGHVGPSQSVVTTDGPRAFTLADPLWQSIGTYVRYGEDEAAATTFRTTGRMSRLVGLSPTGVFDFEFSALSTLMDQGGFAPNDPFPVTAIALVMELESRAAGSGRPRWIDRCK